MDSHTTRIRNITTNILVFAMAIVSIIVAILDLGGLLDNSGYFIQRIPSLTLLAVGFIAGYLILDHRGKLEEILQAIEVTSSRTVRSLQGVEIRFFKDGTEFLRYFDSRIKTAKRIDDLNWRDEISTRSGTETEIASKLERTITNVASKPHVIWREIVALKSKNNRFERVKRLIGKKIAGYNVAYYSARSIGEPPRITFAVLDDEEVFLARPEHKLAIRHPDLATFFSKYYEDVWNSGTKLKNVNQVNGEEINRLESLLP